MGRLLPSDYNLRITPQTPVGLSAFYLTFSGQ